ncbi:EF-hand domain-containing protein [Rhizobium sp. YIM 134829]|uniref:EF-hand domain-containing protein n=1 Tax=Rhizobium sp. YIM 134829 TaxID=3390453 RepID=UPI00397930BA
MQTKRLLLGFAALSLAVTGAVAPSFAKKPPEARGERMIRWLDTNKDGKVSLDEAENRATIAFAAFDADKDGQVSKQEVETKRKAFREARQALREARKNGTDLAAARAELMKSRPAMLPGAGSRGFDRADTDKNGTLSLAEVTAQVGERFKKRDRNGDGFLDASDFAKRG